jgi:hypothetical protein
METYLILSGKFSRDPVAYRCRLIKLAQEDRRKRHVDVGKRVTRTQTSRGKPIDDPALLSRSDQSTFGAFGGVLVSLGRDRTGRSLAWCTGSTCTTRAVVRPHDTNLPTVHQHARLGITPVYTICHALLFI